MEFYIALLLNRTFIELENKILLQHFFIIFLLTLSFSPFLFNFKYIIMIIYNIYCVHNNYNIMVLNLI